MVDMIKMLVIPVIVLIATYTSASLSVSLITSNSTVQWGLILFSCAVSILIGATIYESLLGGRPKFNRIDKEFVCSEYRVEMEYMKPDELIYKKTKIVTAAKDNLKIYTDKYRWTGDDGVSIRCLDPTFRFSETGPHNVWMMYVVDFQRTLKKGDSVNVEIHWTLSDRSGKMVPFISATIEEPTSKLVLRLKTGPMDGRVSKVLGELSSHLGAKSPYSTDIIKKGNGDEYEWVILKPKLLHYYELRWIVV